LTELFMPHSTRRGALLLITCGALALTSFAPAGQVPSGADATIGAEMRAQIIDGALGQLERAYVFPDVAQKMADAVKARASNKEYDSITSARTFAETLTRHLQDVSHDKHLRVMYTEEPLPARRGPPSAEERARMLESERRRNFGFDRVERLEGNVGYLELRAFSGSPHAHDTAVAAMNFLAGTDALVIDLRRNGGGSPAMIGLISSYLFEDVVHLNDFYLRESGETRQFWTSPHVEGRRFGRDKPVYVLTSARTFSAAEEFTYNLKHLKRATIVGETTGGGAHPGGVRRITDHFGIWVPNGRAINPITKTNWEGTGVEPDVKVAAADALSTAHLDALQKVRSTVDDARLHEEIDRAIATLKKKGGTDQQR
jgi:retinol-binding protein 3